MEITIIKKLIEELFFKLHTQTHSLCFVRLKIQDVCGLEF